MPSALGAGQTYFDSSLSYIAVNALETVLERIGCIGKIRFSEVQDDCTIRRRVLQAGQLQDNWQSCLRSGEILVTLLHASDKIRRVLATHGCPLLPLQEGSEHLDWLRLRSRFLGNWRNIHNVLRFMQKKCPHLQLENLDPNSGDVIVDCVEFAKSRAFTLASLTHCLVLLHTEKQPAAESPPAPATAGTAAGMRFQASTTCAAAAASVAAAAIPAPVPLAVPAMPSGRPQQQPQPQQPQRLDVNNSAGLAPPWQPQPKLGRLNSDRRVTCVYDTTTSEEDARSAPRGGAADGQPLAGDCGGGGGGGGGGIGSDGGGGGGGRRCAISISAETVASILRRLDEIKALLLDSSAEGGRCEPRAKPLQLATPPPPPSPLLLPPLSVPLPPATALALQKHHQHMQQQQQQQQQQPRASRKREVSRSQDGRKQQRKRTPLASDYEQEDSIDGDTGDRLSEEDTASVGKRWGKSKSGRASASRGRQVKPAASNRSSRMPSRQKQPQPAAYDDEEARSSDVGGNRRTSRRRRRRSQTPASGNSAEASATAQAGRGRSAGKPVKVASREAGNGGGGGERRRPLQPPPVPAPAPAVAAGAPATAKTVAASVPVAGDIQFTRSTIQDLILRLQSVLSEESG